MKKNVHFNSTPRYSHYTPYSKKLSETAKTNLKIKIREEDFT